MERWMRLEYRLSRGEFARACLGGYYRYPVWGVFRILCGPVLIALGSYVRAIKIAPWFGVLAIAYGCFYILNPLLNLALNLRRCRDTVLERGEEGMRIRSDSTEHTIA